VVGGGAAGLTAAFFAARAGASVRILERNGEAGKKILMSGGTRANVLPLAYDADADFFTDGSRTLLRRVLASWPLEDAKRWLEEDVGVALSLEAETGKFFPTSNSGRSVRDALVAAAQRAGASVTYRASVEALARAPDGRWRCDCADGASFSADALVLSTGGLSFPAVGTDGTGHRVAARDLGHSLQAPFPALVPLLGAHPGGGPGALAGLSLQTVRVRAGEGAKAPTSPRGGFLFTHRGFSGPALLDVSHRHVVAAAAGAPLRIVADWSGEGRSAWAQRLAAPGAQLASTRLAAALPARLAAALLAHAGVPAERKAAELRREERERLLDALTAFELPVSGHAGFAKAEVTGGGVALAELDVGSMESKRAPGVHLCGELCDAFGRIGGFNFLWAWNSGRLAGLGAAGAAGAAARPKKAAKPAAVRA